METCTPFFISNKIYTIIFGRLKKYLYIYIIVKQNNNTMAKTREQMMVTLKTKYPKLFVNTTEEFNGNEGGIWMCGEDYEVVDRKDNRIFDYYSDSSSYDVRSSTNIDRWAISCWAAFQ